MPPPAILFRIPVTRIGGQPNRSSVAIGHLLDSFTRPREFTAVAMADICPGELCVIASGKDGQAVLPARMVSVPKGMAVAHRFDAQSAHAKGDTIELLEYASGVIVEMESSWQ